MTRPPDEPAATLAAGVNPFLTISMFAESAAEHLRAELDLPGYDPAREADDL